MFFTHFVFFLLLEIVSQANAKCQKYVDAASTAAKTLQSKYFNGGTYGSQAVWIGAVDAMYLGTLDSLTGGQDYHGVIDTVFKGQENYLDTGKSYDDVQWVSLAYLRYGNTEMAKKYYDIASTAIDSSYCGGGLFWSGARDYKNAITNELYMATSGYLHSVTQDEKYLQNLKTAWDWINSSKLRGSNGLFNDGLTKDGKCENNQQTQWTYNQGTILVGLAFLYKSGDQQALKEAYRVIDAMINNLTVDGGLREACEDKNQNLCNADQQTFKGIAVYFVSWFLSITGQDNEHKYADFVKSQADKVLSNAAVGEGTYRSLWYAQGSTDPTSQSQGSALGALVGAGILDC